MFLIDIKSLSPIDDYLYLRNPKYDLLGKN